MDGIDKLIDSIKRIIRKETEAYDTAATVRRIEGNTAWVHIDGGVDETPVKLTINAQPGDNVQVRVSGGKAFLVGNGSAPPTDDTTAIYARSIATTAQTTAEGAQEAAEAVTGIATAASNNASAAITLAEGIDDHFWSDSAGAHITEDTQEDYLDDPSAAGGNTLITSAGMAIRHGTTQLAAFTGSGSQIGQNAEGQSRIIIASDGLNIIQKSAGVDEELAHIAYGPSDNTDPSSSPVPYYTLGVRTGQLNGQYSMVEGADNEASGLFSHAEGWKTTAWGQSAHSEGEESEAYGDYSHAQNLGTAAGPVAQTALGTYNDFDGPATPAVHPSGDSDYGTYAVIIGNGIDENNRSNALTVDWSGNVEATGDIEDGSGNVLANKIESSWHCYGNYYGATATTTLSTSDKKIPLKTFSGSGCSSSSNGIKIDSSHAGTYSISGAVYATTGYTANDIVHASLYVNSTQVADGFKRVSNGSPYEVLPVGPIVMTLSAGDVVYLYAKNQTGARGNVANYDMRNVGLNLYRIG